MPTSFLDLPAELRNRVYEFFSNLYSELPIRVIPSDTNSTVFLSTAENFKSLLDCGHGSVIDDLQPNHVESNHNRLAMLYTNKQIHHEAWSIFYGSMTLNVSNTLEQSTVPQIHHAMDILGSKLCVIPRLEISAGVARVFLWRRTFDPNEVHERPDWDYNWRTFPRCPLRHIPALLAFRQDLSGLQSTTIKNTHQGPYTDMIAARTLVGLADPVTRDVLHELFPKLNEIILTNPCGSERFVRPDSEGWQRAYTKEKIPANVHLILRSVYDTAMYLQSGHFTAADALEKVGPKPVAGKKESKS